ncbi:MAG: dihydroorotate dehydrogenase electron transfer subunit [Candidatus Hadarchaeales archaeon]
MRFEELGMYPARVERVVRESPTVVSLYLRSSLPREPLPGQFVMVWLPGKEEVPMSVSGWDGKRLRISVARMGETTSRLQEIRRGRCLGMKGPLGRGFRLGKGPHLLVGGGTGMAPLIFACRRLRERGVDVKVLVGAKTNSELLFVSEAKRTGAEVEVATEDGSGGEKGMVTDLLERELPKRPWKVLACGPEEMLVKVVEECMRRRRKVQVSLERYMRCGLGVCGSCVLDPVGWRVCTEGPVFDGRLLLRTDFGKFERDSTGRRLPLSSRDFRARDR